LPADSDIYKSRWAHADEDTIMAEVDSREYGRGGGYRGGNGGGRKRNYRGRLSSGVVCWIAARGVFKAAVNLC